MGTRLTLEDVERAAAIVSRHLRPTPLRPSLAAAGVDLRLKLECWQPTGSFKVRGATHLLSTLSAAERRRGVVAASAGNHALGVAFAAARLGGVKATLFVPTTAPRAKVDKLRRFPVERARDGRDLRRRRPAPRARSRSRKGPSSSTRSRTRARPPGRARSRSRSSRSARRPPRCSSRWAAAACSPEWRRCSRRARRGLGSWPSSRRPRPRSPSRSASAARSSPIRPAPRSPTGSPAASARSPSTTATSWTRS